MKNNKLYNENQEEKIHEKKITDRRSVFITGRNDNADSVLR